MLMISKQLTINDCNQLSRLVRLGRKNTPALHRNNSINSLEISFSSFILTLAVLVPLSQSYLIQQ